MRNDVLSACLVLALLAPIPGAGVVLAVDEADEAMPGVVTVVRPGKLAKFVAKPAAGGAFMLPTANDPTVEGGSLRMFDTGGAAGDNTYALPVQPAPYGWKALGTPPGVRGYKYKGAGTPADPCRVVVVKNTVVKGVCRSGIVTLAPPFAGDVAVALRLGSGTKRYCARFGGTEVKNDPTITKRKAAAAAPCAPEPPPPPPAGSIFVDTVAGDDGNPGTMAAPKATVQAGISAAQLAAVDVYVSAGTYDESLTLADGVSVFGGYDAAAAWTFSPANVVTVVGGTSAVLGTEIDAETRLENLTVIAADNPAPGGSSHGLYLVGSSGVVLVNASVQAGMGGPGMAGTSGAPGAGGGNGGQGNPGCEDSSGFCSSCSQPAPGLGGASSCGRTGGLGGAPGHGTGCGSVGGTGLIGTPGGPGGCPGEDGTAGSPGALGTPGAGGPGGDAMGSLTVSGYSPAGGGVGVAGSHGNGGGGGGGGAGGDDNCDSYGSSGGGGGGGGCAGGPGGGGTGGGGSFAVYLWDSSVALTDVALATAGGGAGGAGGAGGSGGAGGGGGPGGPYGGGGEQDDGTNGAVGGPGGDGGGGGAGGGGGGGPSVGIACGGASGLALDVGTTYALGSPGAAGPSAGNPGSAGLQAAQVGC